MSDPAKDKTEKTEKLPEVRAPAEVQRGAVISGQVHQNHWKGMDKAHWLDQDESATGLFFKQGEASQSSSKFGIDGLEQEAPRVNANGTAYRVFTQPAAMSPTKIDPISPELTKGDYQSSVKLNVQISQIPEVPAPLTGQDALEYTSTVMAAGAAAVQKTEHHMTEANAINSDIAGMLEHFSRSPNQINQDVLNAVTGLMDQIDKPLKPEQRAEMAGAILPLFFFEGEKEPIAPNVAKEMKLDKMTADELRAIRVERKLHPLDSAEPLSRYRDLLPPFIEGGPTHGMLVSGDFEFPLVSGVNGPAAQVAKGTRGFDGYTRTHVEGHSAAFMKQNGIQHAKLYINNPRMCSPCDRLLPRMLEEGSTLEVFLPDGTSRLFIGGH
jgi:SCP1.201-like deaminase